MPRTQDHLVMKWIIAFGSMAVLLVIYGGFVRLTRAGLSIVEWNPVSGAVPPMTSGAWEVEFAKYQSTPEYQQINRGMTLPEYREIFLIEWIHRFLARLAGFVFAVPFFIFLFTGRIPWKESALYVVMGALFLLQAVMGWVMVSSGLVERPSVSHFLLAAHLFLALSLIGLSAWTALGHYYGFPPPSGQSSWSSRSIAALMGLAFLLAQMAYGAFTAGLKAGLVSNTWPMMLGRLLPGGLLDQVQPPISNLVEAPLTVAFIHRWFAWVVLLAAGMAARIVLRGGVGLDLHRTVRHILLLGLLQIGLGVAVVVSGVSIALASLHQFNALALFLLGVFLLYRLRRQDRLDSPAASI